jgi:hypothetical protein
MKESLTQQSKRYASEWSGAYRADYNGREVSEQIILAMLKRGYTEEQAKWVYFSKHLRWFFDSQGDSVSKSKARKLFDAYLAKGSNGVRADLKQLSEGIEP